MAFTDDNVVFGWGSSLYKQLGSNESYTSNIPVIVNVSPFNLTSKFKSMCCGDYFIVILREDGTVFSWGDNYYGSLGNNLSAVHTFPPTSPILQNSSVSVNFTKISCGFASSGYILQKGDLLTVGYNNYFQLGTTSPDTALLSPVNIDGIRENFTGIFAGSYSGYALSESGSVYVAYLCSYC
jgi:alpha-tubulin suppressor-like RCC1 family protein